MSDVQILSTSSTVGAIASLGLSEGDYKRIIARLQNDIKEKNERLKGIRVLTVLLHETEERCKRWEEMAKNLEATLRRAEARIAHLNQMHGIGPQAAFNRGPVFPGVSRKDFELVTQENLKLKKALDHIVAANLGGHEVIVCTDPGSTSLQAKVEENICLKKQLEEIKQVALDLESKFKVSSEKNAYLTRKCELFYNEVNAMVQRLKYYEENFGLPHLETTHDDLTRYRIPPL